MMWARRGDDFVADFAAIAPAGRPAAERAILGVIIKYGPSDAAQLAHSGRARIRFLDYNWSLNDVVR